MERNIINIETLPSGKRIGRLLYSKVNDEVCDIDLELLNSMPTVCDLENIDLLEDGVYPKTDFNEVVLAADIVEHGQETKPKDLPPLYTYIGSSSTTD